ncbi:MAG: response regulator [Candidatus Binatia bacterium]
MLPRDPVVRRFTARYLIGLGLVWLAALIGQAAVRLALEQRAVDIAFFAQAVQQRARGLEAADKASRIVERMDDAVERGRSAEVDELLRDFERAQQDLRRGRLPSGATAKLTPEMRHLLDEVEPPFRALHGAVRVTVAVAEAPAAVAERTDVLPTVETITAHGRSFARGMDSVLARARQEMSTRAVELRRLQVVLLGFVLVVLVLEAVFVFRPGGVEVAGVLDALRAAAADAAQHAEEAGARAAALEAELAAAGAAAQGKFGYLAGLSRDLRTRMTNIVGMTSLVQETELTPEQRDYVDAVRSSADHLEELVNDVLDLTELEAGKFALGKEAFRLRRVLADALAAPARAAAAKGTELVCRIGVDLPDAFTGDGRRLRQIVTNLLGASIESTRQGEVVLAVHGVEGSAGAVAFEITDTGSGLHTEAQRALGATSGAVDGARLGLGVTARLAAMMGEPIVVECTSGKGSRLAFTARLAPDAKAPPELPPPELVGLPVVVIDDNAAARDAVADMLRGLGIEPVVAATAPAAATAFAATGASAPAVVLVDARLGGAAAADVVAKVHAAAALATASLVLLVPPGGRGTGEAAELLLAKPVLPAALVDALALAMAAGPEESATAPATDADPEAVADAAGDPGAAAPYPLQVLVADDNAVNRLVVVRMLEKQGHRVVPAADGAAALAALDDGDFDLVVLDVEMPEMDGFQATAEIRDRERRRGTHVPIVAITAGALEGERDRCLAAGMDAYLAKPVRAEQLVATIAALRPGAATLAPDPVPEAPFDDARLVELAGGNADGALDVVRQFGEDTRRALGAARDGLAAGEADRVTRAAIRLRGTLGALAAWPAYGPVQQLESLGRSGELDAAAETLQVVEGLLGQLEAALVAASDPAPVVDHTEAAAEPVVADAEAGPAEGDTPDAPG